MALTRLCPGLTPCGLSGRIIFGRVTQRLGFLEVACIIPSEDQMVNQYIRLVGMLCFAGICFGQDEQPEKQGNQKAGEYHIPWWAPTDDRAKWILFGGYGINEQSGTAGSVEASSPRKLVNFGGAIERVAFFELSYLGPAEKLNSSQSWGSVLFSTGMTSTPTLGRIGKIRFDLPCTLGYTRMIRTANAVNFGAGLDVIWGKDHGIRFEVRDYFKLSGHNEHNVVFRIAYLRLVDT